MIIQVRGHNFKGIGIYEYACVYTLTYTHNGFDKLNLKSGQSFSDYIIVFNSRSGMLYLICRPCSKG